MQRFCDLKFRFKINKNAKDREELIAKPLRKLADFPSVLSSGKI